MLPGDTWCRTQRPPGASARVRAPAPHTSQTDGDLTPERHATPPRHWSQTPGHAHGQRRSTDHDSVAVTYHGLPNTRSRYVASLGESAAPPQAADHQANFS